MRSAEHTVKGRYDLMTTIGHHLLVELTGCPAAKLTDIEFVKHEIHAAALAAQATILNGYFHQFSPSGVSGVLCLAESHISIHTWPEVGYATVDIYTCGATAKPHRAVAHVVAAFEAEKHHVLEMTRGVHDDGGRFVSVPLETKKHADAAPAHHPKPVLSTKKYKPMPVE